MALMLLNGNDFHINNYKEHNPIRYVGEITVLVLCTLSDDAVYLYSVS